MRDLQTWGSRPPCVQQDAVAYWILVAIILLFMLMIFE